MSLNNPVLISRWLLTMLATRMFIYHENRIPLTGPLLVVSNHRSFMDAPLLMMALGRPIHFACHYYMGQVPILRDMVKLLGAFPLAESDRKHLVFFRQASSFLQAGEAVGVFPEGGTPMVKFSQAGEIGDFHRGFAHLAWRSPLENLIVLPVAIAAFEEEVISSLLPLKLLSVFDPSEPLFDQPGWHPMVIYHRVNIMIGKPYYIVSSKRQEYQGKYAKIFVNEFSDQIRGEIAEMLRQGCY